MANLLIVGTGQLGSRYLQGMVNCTQNLDIVAMDPSAKALDIAKARWLEAKGADSNHSVNWCQELPSDARNFDLAILSTPAKGRSALVYALSKQATIRYWILEKVLAQSADELEIIKQATAKADGCWVNTARRLMHWHQTLKNNLYTNAPLYVEKYANLWGLACNSIHFIDLVAWWTNEKLLSLDTSGLDLDWFESKRLGFFEITGTLTAYYSGGSKLVLSAQHDAPDQGLHVQTASGESWLINELAGEACGSHGKRIDGTLEYQSTMTSRLISSILVNGSCDLPTLQESSQMHGIFLDAMLAHWNHSHNIHDTLIPIT